ncbi:hypothetical protein C8R43DRAFT_986806 [Mycena crocata]|nr:hypothetical protein C8R43DRAFT_986806 [Mycena crocata]
MPTSLPCQRRHPRLAPWPSALPLPHPPLQHVFTFAVSSPPPSLMRLPHRTCPRPRIPRAAHPVTPAHSPPVVSVRLAASTESSLAAFVSARLLFATYNGRDLRCVLLQIPCELNSFHYTTHPCCVPLPPNRLRPLRHSQPRTLASIPMPHSRVTVESASFRQESCTTGDRDSLVCRCVNPAEPADTCLIRAESSFRGESACIYQVRALHRVIRRQCRRVCAPIPHTNASVQ